MIQYPEQCLVYRRHSEIDHIPKGINEESLIKRLFIVM